MIKATYVIPPSSNISYNTIASRVLYTNTINNKKLDVNISTSGFENFELSDKAYNKYLIDTENLDSNIPEYFKSSVNGKHQFHYYYSFSEEILNNTVNSVDSDYVIVSLFSLLDLNLVKLLLEKELKVLIGGVCLSLYTTSKIKHLLISIGTKKELLNNLIIYKGHLDSSINLHKILIEGKDVIASDNIDLSYVWTSHQDFYNMYYKDKYKKIFETQGISVIFNDGCWYGKCKFCTSRFLPKNNFVGNLSDDELFINTMKMVKLYNTKSVSVLDPYVKMTDQIRTYCKRLRKEGIKVLLYTSTKFLLNDKAIKFFNECADSLKIGIESCDDFTLDHIKKGHTYQDILDMATKIKSKMRSDIKLVFCNIFDLPYKTKKDVIQNQKRYVNLKEQLLESFDYVHFIFTLYMNYPSLELTNNNIFYSNVTNEKREDHIGIWKLWNNLEDYGIKLNMLENIWKPIIRKDISGNILKSDIDIISKDDLRFLC